MLAHRNGLIDRIDALELIRTSTRREIFRRISLATDYLHSNYRQPIDLESLGKAACLSKYHFLRLFTRVHGITPHQYLLRKRAKTALRLLQTTPLDVCEIASSVGFAQRHALLRQMRRWTGLSPREIRRAESVPALES
jgi:AraC family transcriptional regulator